MPIEARPLFRPDVLRKQLAYFNLSETVKSLRPDLAKWAELIDSGRVDKLKEQEILPDFLTFFFGRLLGYTGPADDLARRTISREQHVQVDGKFADAVLGIFEGDRFLPIVAVEGKGPLDPLDRPFAGRKMSAVDQGYRYAINLPCDWIIVISIRSVRLYHKGSTQQSFERFEIARLATDQRLLEKFVFLLAAERIAPREGRCHLYDLLTASEKVGRELTRKYYLLYADQRQQAFERLCQDNPAIDRHVVLQCTQKMLDRILFCAFCKDRALLPADTLDRAYQHRDPYNPRPIWDNFKGLFRAVDKSDASLNIPGYNGGLFALDKVLDSLLVPDEVCKGFNELAGYDYRPPHEVAADADAAKTMVDVEILGHIFEQSITDLEAIRSDLARDEPAGLDAHRARRKREGAFYTPKFITRYIVEQALRPTLQERFERLRQEFQDEARGAAKAALADPNVFDADSLNKAQRDALMNFWRAWETELGTIRLLDPACGSGAFLIEAFDFFHAAHQAIHGRLRDLRGHMELFDLDRHILENNLFGVDLNEEAVEICRLSLWIRTAERGKTLTNLDPTIKVGNSIIADPAVHSKAFDWRSAFPRAFDQGGFDVVVGNPPYVRQELLSPFKPYLETAYRAYHGMADLYVYFYELGIRLLKPGGRLSYIVTNKWMKAGYGEPLRRFFSERTWIESVVDFGHAKQIFEDADVFPSIIVARKPTNEPKPATARLCTIPREQLRIDDLSVQIEQEGIAIPKERLGVDTWNLEPPKVGLLLEKLRERGQPLGNFANVKPLMGIKTGLNEAFLIESSAKEALIAADPGCANILKPYIRGQDLERWHSDWAGLWMIALKSSENCAWPWSEAGAAAERLFQETYPSLHARMKSMEEALRKRQDKGRFWWELRSCAYWQEFESPRIVYQEIQFHPSYAFDKRGQLGNNKTFFIVSQDLYLLAVLNSPLMWWHNWRYLPHMKDEALTPVAFLMENLPIAEPSAEVRSRVETAASKLIAEAQGQHDTRHTFLDWLRVQFDIVKPSQKLQAPAALDQDALIAEVKKARGKKKPLTIPGLKALREEYARTLQPMRLLADEALKLEQQISDLVNQAYGLTPDEIDLMWKTAPPRMPVGRG